MSGVSKIIRDILSRRGVLGAAQAAFLRPDYDATRYDPFLLPDMDKAVGRILRAQGGGEKIVIYGDYDVDGMCATAILLDAFQRFGLSVESYTPNRFTEGYGLNMDAMRGLAATDASLVVTVDCGSLSHDEIEVAGKLGLDVIVTDHHALGETLPPAVAVVNPHRVESKYTFADLAGCGVAFKLVQALQQRVIASVAKQSTESGKESGSPRSARDDSVGLPVGQEKWLLDLVALGTVCDIVPLLDENRNNVYWGIEVLKKTRRPGLRALMAVTKLTPSTLNARAIGFVIGPRLNAAGRLATAQTALELLTTNDAGHALELAQNLDSLNSARRIEQNKIFAEICEILDNKNPDYKDSPCKSGESVIVVDKDGWNEGIIGIVASKVVERYRRPAFVVARGDESAKGSGRSFGDFSLAEAIEATREHLTKGGGHAAAGGVSLPCANIELWRQALNDYYKKLNLKNQAKYLLPSEDVTQENLATLDTDLVRELAQLEPFGLSNERPIFRLSGMRAKYVDRIGKKAEHLKLTVMDSNGDTLKFLAFDPPPEWFVEPGEKISLWVSLEINEWQGAETVEGRILRIELA
ncbi:MAG: single-stranded-DNA-specific exonuclease RecJ [Candidatus Nomurabacteria bacterium]|jgi:single-stranded-DNA-specific exonuclease|nr:single-stranded-DNA-specific exonuclease RecJ [Candidatus Nomurabacteria bacterium]